MKKTIISIVILFIAVAIVVVNFWNTSKAVKTNEQADLLTEEDTPGVDLSEVQEGKPAPDFNLRTLEGETVKLSDYRGKKVILNFWATWCPPCKEEMPHMQNFYENNERNGIEIIAVNLTSAEKGGKDNIKNFVKEYGITFTIPLDEDGTIGMKYQAFTIPTSYFIDTNGIIIKKIVGPMDENMMETLTKDMK